MNKIKIIYDVVRKMKDKETIKGTFKAEGLKDQEKTFSINNTFERTSKDGQVKGKTNMEADFDGKKIKLENSIDFQGGSCCGHRGFMKHMHLAHNHQHDMHRGGLKEHLGRISAILGILSSIKLEEKEDRSVVLSLQSADIPEEIRNDIQEMMKHGHEHHQQMAGNHQHHMFIKEFHDMEKKDFVLNVFISKDSELEKVTINVSGEKQDEKNESHDMKLSAELCLE